MTPIALTGAEKMAPLVLRVDPRLLPAATEADGDLSRLTSTDLESFKSFLPNLLTKRHWFKQPERLEDNLFKALGLAVSKERIWTVKGNSTSKVVRIAGLRYNAETGVNEALCGATSYITSRALSVIPGLLKPHILEDLLQQAAQGRIWPGFMMTSGLHVYGVTSDNFIVTGMRSSDLAVNPNMLAPIAETTDLSDLGMEKRDGDTRLIAQRCMREEGLGDSAPFKIEQYLPLGTVLVTNDNGLCDLVTAFAVRLGCDLVTFNESRTDESRFELPTLTPIRLGSRVPNGMSGIPSLPIHIEAVNAIPGLATEVGQIGRVLPSVSRYSA